MKIKSLKLLLLISSISLILISNSFTNCQNTTSTNSTNQTIDKIDIKNTSNNDPIVNPTVKNQTEIQQQDKFNIEIYRSKTQNKSEIGAGYVKFINFKEEVYVTPFKRFNNKFSPEMQEYNQQIYSLGSYWFAISGLSGLLFVIYVVLNRFFGKFRGSKKENLDEDFKNWAWGVFCNFLFYFFILFLSYFLN